MKKWVGILFVVLFLASFANADTLTLVSAPYGVNGPYSLSLNGSKTTSPMICYSENNHVTYGETWNVQAYTIDTVSALAGKMFGGTSAADTIFKYNLLGYLADQLFANPGNADLQNAIWAVLGNGGGVMNSKYNDAVAWLKAHPEYKTSNVFYIPIGDFSNNPLGVPQPFIVQAAEPGSMLLLGAGLLGWARFRKRKLA
jgi:hypothetical protein